MPETQQIINACLILVLGVALFFILEFGVKKFRKLADAKDRLRESPGQLRVKTLVGLFHWLGSIMIVLGILYMLLATFGVNVGPLLAGAGIAGVAVGFGGQYLIRDIINGVFILLEDHYRINDVVKLGDHGGLVEEVNLRYTKLRDLEGRVIYVPNGEIKTVINFTKEFAYALINVGVSYEEDIDKAIAVIKEVGKTMRADPYFDRLILDDLEMLGVDEFADSQVTLIFRIKTLPIKQWEVAREYRRRLKKRFDELGISIPFPQRTLHLGKGAGNEWLKELLSQKKNISGGK